MFFSETITPEDTYTYKTGRRDSLNIEVNQYEEVMSRYKRTQYREISTTPYKILDAPGVTDDYYLNLIDWCGDRVIIALGENVYSYNVKTKDADLIYTARNSYISSIKGKDNLIAFGDSTGRLRVYDVVKEKFNYSKKIQNGRISALSFHSDFLSSGDKTGQIINTDFRSKIIAGELNGHSSEICGLKWNSNLSYLASGSNDNTVRIWRAGRSVSNILKGHNSAVKAMDWCGWQDNVLCTGGGSQDKTIRVWDVVNQSLIKTISTDSQVCTLHCLDKNKEMVTGHGFCNNDLKLWKFQEMKLIKSFGSHESRILHTAVSPDQSSLVSMAPDDNVKFWKISENAKNNKKNENIFMM